MKPYKWNQEKNKKLSVERHIDFNEIVDSIQSGNLVDTINHFNKDKYPNQKIFIVKVQDYIYLVPFVENEVYYFLKTIIPSSKYTKKLLNKK